ncbi:MAG TPA: ectonucleotide pyrophosphatase/phosphodiesterase [Steroidobacteraceae bacterium]|nr:ectonucleotide pyrophosphatase/phosphodiesterase [Steroidobacteraceae bacterium]
MKYRVALLVLSCVVGSCAAAASAAASDASSAPMVLLISVDGMKPEAIIDAQSHGLKVANLRAFMTEGAYASGVRGVLPTLTYPSHTTLLTGASPAKHGIYDNTTFDPLQRNQRGWYWYAEDIKVPTLWDAAAAAHLKTANIYWPVSVGANITYNLPQIWRTGTDDDLKLQRALSTAGLEQELSADLGRYPGGMEETVAEDEIRARFAIRLLEKKHPSFFTVYLTGLDTEEHLSGPFSPKANETLERLDAVVGSLRAAAEKAAPGRATICVVSDHGFAAVEHDVNLYAAFRDAGLITVDKDNAITGWKAMLWPAGGSAAVMLADPADQTVRARVKALLDKLASDPANGIERIWSPEEMQRGGGFPQAAYLISLRIGYETAYSLSLPLITKPSNLGMHGYVPERAEMKSSFFVVGPHIARGRALGEIDMRQIAPTIADILRVRLAGAEVAGMTLN